MEISYKNEKKKQLLKRGLNGSPHWWQSVADKKNSILQYAVFATILFGVKLWLIGTYGNMTPFWDQWDAEADLLYKPFLNGTLSWEDLFKPHNEHRIFTTRVLALALLGINQVWNPILQMVVNAALHVGMLMFGVLLISRVVGRNYLPALLAFSLILFAVPYGWENTLAGFQAQFYFVLLFSVASLWLTVTKDPLSGKWWAGMACGLLAFFSLASGVFALAAAAVINLVFYLFGFRRNYKQLLAVAVLSGIFILCIWFTPTQEHHAPLKAASFQQFYEALVTVLGWPISSSFLGAVMRNLPAIIFLGLLIWKRPKANDPLWFLAGLMVWVLGQAVSIGYGRAVAVLASRYLDLFAIGILINFACLIAVAKYYINDLRRWTLTGVGIWLALLLLSLGHYSNKTLPAELETKHKTSLEQENNTRNYLATGDFNYLKDKPLLSIPYPNAERLASILSTPEIRAILPANINYQVRSVSTADRSADVFVLNGYYPTTPQRADSVYGSYNSQGDGGIGKRSIKFQTKITSGIVEIPVAGYPLNNGMKVEIEQQGQKKVMSIESNPKESWGTASGRIKGGEFTVHLTDSSTTTWVAVGSPTVITKLDHLTSNLVANYYLFLLVGIALAVFLFVQNSLVKTDIKHVL